jgi:hypothetical protein
MVIGTAEEAQTAQSHPTNEGLFGSCFPALAQKRRKDGAPD